MTAPMLLFDSRSHWKGTFVVHVCVRHYWMSVSQGKTTFQSFRETWCRNNIFLVLWHGRSRKWVGKQDDSTTLQSINSMHWRPPLQRIRIEIRGTIAKSVLSNCSEMLRLGTYWKTWFSMVSEQTCTIDQKMDQSRAMGMGSPRHVHNRRRRTRKVSNLRVCKHLSCCMAADESQKQIRGVRWSKDERRKSSFCITDGHLSFEECRIGGKAPKISRSSCTPRRHCKRWFWIWCSIHRTMIISITNDGSKSHGYHIHCQGAQDKQLTQYLLIPR